jgi:hypothetical protein
MKPFKSLASTAALALYASASVATPLTETSPLSNTPVATGVTAVGGIVVHLQGQSGANVFAQASASSLFKGTQFVTNQQVGFLGGFTADILSALGSGLTGAAIRISLSDGDSERGGFNYNESRFQVDGVDFGSISNVSVEETDNSGASRISNGTGFRNDLLDTGWLQLTDVAALSTLFSALSDGTINFVWTDSQLDTNFLDFTQGLSGSVIHVGSGPVVTPPTPPSGVPLPGSMALIGLGLLGFGMLRSKKS